MTFKDFLPLIGTVLTLIVGYRLISVQVNKNRKAKWIDDFRKEVSQFFALATATNKEFTVERGYQMLASITSLTLFLVDSKEPRAIQLINELREIHSLALKQWNAEQTDEQIKKYGDKLANIMNLVTMVLLLERKKI